MSVGLKGQVMDQLKAYLVITLYLWLFLGAFTVYRRLISAESDVEYLHYGIALIEALVIAKVIVVGRMFGFSRRFEDRPLIVPVLYKSVLFGLLVLAFSVVERLVAGWIHKQGWWAGLREIAATGGDEIAARILVLVVAFIPFFAFGEIVRVVGAREVMAMFFAKPQSSRGIGRPAS